MSALRVGQNVRHTNGLHGKVVEVHKSGVVMRVNAVGVGIPTVVAEDELREDDEYRVEHLSYLVQSHNGVEHWLAEDSLEAV